MEILGVISVPGWLLTILLLILTFCLYSKWKHSMWKRLGVPGPEPTPFLGILKEYFKKGTCNAELELVRKYGNVVGVYQGHIPSLLVADPEMLKVIFVKEFSNFPNRFIPVKPTERMLAGVALAQGTHWKFLRSTLSPTFTVGKLKLMVQKIDKCCQALVDNIRSQRGDKHPVDMKELCGAFTMDVIASTAFGIEVNSQREPNNRFVYYGKKAAVGQLATSFAVFIMMFPFLKNVIGAILLKGRVGKDVIEFFDTALRSAIDLRKEGKEQYQDFLQLMINARHKDDHQENQSSGDMQSYKNRGLNEMELKSNAMTFFLAGYDTTANTLSFACHALATNSDVQKKLIEEIDTVLCGEKPQYEDISKLQYLERFVNEVLRLYGAAIRFNRECQRDIKIKDTFIPKGTDISVPSFALHRNPDYWPDPEKFDPERFTDENIAKRPEYSFIPFGIGPRICIGMRLALLEAKMALVYMLQNFSFTTCDKTEIPVTFEKGFILKAQNGIVLNVNPRKDTR
ncbi:CYP3A [Mytilus coruscus]|uniref:CYP3A n=1 Tax=Mytilus coruscus TaxID=42192 RepID=A0A6J8C890_MYTCO|nr:CYP3A [Mytilus coruscus]